MSHLVQTSRTPPVHNSALASVDELAVVVIHRFCGRLRLVIAHRAGSSAFNRRLSLRPIRLPVVMMSSCSSEVGVSSASAAFVSVVHAGTILMIGKTSAMAYIIVNRSRGGNLLSQANIS